MLNSRVVNPKVGPLSSHSCNCSDAFWTTRHQVPKVHTHPSVASFATFFPILQATTEHCGNLATRLRVSPLCHDTAFSTVGLALTNHGCTNDASPFSPLAANLASRVGPCMGIVEPFKRVLCVTAHPQVLALELQAPMGTCLGQYGISFH